MKTFYLTSALLIAIGFTACTEKQKPNEQVQDLAESRSKMKNLVSIIEIPTSDLHRAINFYQAILGLKIEEMEMGEVKMGILPSPEGTVNVVLANGSDYKPTPDGNIIYLNAGENLQHILEKIEPNGGKIIVPKTHISPEMGFFALFIDTEGNRVGLHSSN